MNSSRPSLTLDSEICRGNGARACVLAADGRGGRGPRSQARGGGGGGGGGGGAEVEKRALRATGATRTLRVTLRSIFGKAGDDADTFLRKIVSDSKIQTVLRRRVEPQQ